MAIWFTQRYNWLRRGVAHRSRPTCCTCLLFVLLHACNTILVGPGDGPTQGGNTVSTGGSGGTKRSVKRTVLAMWRKLYDHEPKKEDGPGFAGVMNQYLIIKDTLDNRTGKPF